MAGIASTTTDWAEGIAAELQRKLPGQRKTQRGKLALLVATMLNVRSANLVELASGLPLAAERTDMRYQWIARFLANDRVDCDAVMQPFAIEILANLARDGRKITLIMDQTKASDRHQILMLSVGFGERALPLAWRVEETDGGVAGNLPHSSAIVQQVWTATLDDLSLASGRASRVPRQRPPSGNRGGFRLCESALAQGCVSAGAGSSPEPRG